MDTRPATVMPTSLPPSPHRPPSRRRAVPASCSAAIRNSDRGERDADRMRSADVAGLPEPGDRIGNRLAIGPRDIADLAPGLGVIEEHVMARHAQAVHGRGRSTPGDYATIIRLRGR